ncbi:hypothetical protein [Pseudoponticoccus marisrubri]|uniref:Uncharacterized protein n=1 Tax=Pseudoponticoccus marisrubri TaxID=1685382 RepID=A0A0W7WEU3_9RHOB|nr:hypothetical protein [Pseudoponticoccus marisrubri]KUF09078.1 hypothetical protein AVJ23_19315 [Pseudoponticoccus marisrubri]
MSDLKNAILDAKYIDMISLGDFVVRDCGLPDVDSDGNLMPQATEIAAALFRWAADVQNAAAAPTAAAAATQTTGDTPLQEYDENGDPIMDAEEAEKLEAELKAKAQEHS